MTEEEEVNKEYEANLPWMKIFGALLQSGLDLFEPNGVVEGPTPEDEVVGIECLLDLRTFFEKKESYGRAKFINEIIIEYHERWPELYAKAEPTIFNANPTDFNSTNS